MAEEDDNINNRRRRQPQQEDDDDDVVFRYAAGGAAADDLRFQWGLPGGRDDDEWLAARRPLQRRRLNNAAADGERENNNNEAAGRNDDEEEDDGDDGPPPLEPRRPRVAAAAARAGGGERVILAFRAGAGENERPPPPGAGGGEAAARLGRLARRGDRFGGGGDFFMRGMALADDDDLEEAILDARREGMRAAALVDDDGGGGGEPPGNMMLQHMEALLAAVQGGGAREGGGAARAARAGGDEGANNNENGGAAAQGRRRRQQERRQQQEEDAPAPDNNEDGTDSVFQNSAGSSSDEEDEDDVWMRNDIQEFGMAATASTPTPDQYNFSSWRDDPSESFSDWRIDVVRPKTTDTYHVHKAMVATGRRRSLRFAAEFRHAGRFAETGHSRLELHDLAADAMPVVLDYLYDLLGSLKKGGLKRSNAVPVKFLLDYLDIPSGRKECLDYIRKSMGTIGKVHLPSNVELFYQHANVFCDEQVLTEIEVFFAKMLGSALNGALSDTALETFSQFEPNFLLRIISSELCLVPSALNGNNSGSLASDLTKSTTRSLRSNSKAPPPCQLVTKPEVSLCWSRVVAYYCESNQVDAETFNRLTHASVMPTVEVTLAPKLLRLQERIVGKVDKGSGAASLKDDKSYHEAKTPAENKNEKPPEENRKPAVKVNDQKPTVKAVENDDDESTATDAAVVAPETKKEAPDQKNEQPEEPPALLYDRCIAALKTQHGKITFTPKDGEVYEFFQSLPTSTMMEVFAHVHAQQKKQVEDSKQRVQSLERRSATSRPTDGWGNPRNNNRDRDRAAARPGAAPGGGGAGAGPGAGGAAAAADQRMRFRERLDQLERFMMDGPGGHPPIPVRMMGGPAGGFFLRRPDRDRPARHGWRWVGMGGNDPAAAPPGGRGGGEGAGGGAAPLNADADGNEIVD